MIIQKILERYLKEIKIPFILSSLLLFFILCIFGKCISHINNKDKQIIELQNYIIGLQEEKINLSNKILEQKEYIVTLENAEPKDFNLNNFTIEEQFKLASQIYNIDYKLIYAIGRLETGNFTSDLCVNHNNFGGMKAANGEWMSFNSSYEGILEMARNLKKYYIDKGLDTVEKIAPIYCPPSADDWSQKIYTLMNEIS